jgi:hypothetical protein
MVGIKHSCGSERGGEHRSANPLRGLNSAACSMKSRAECCAGSAALVSAGLGPTMEAISISGPTIVAERNQVDIGGSRFIR